MDQNRHKVKRQRSNKRPESPSGGDEKNLHHRNLPRGHPQGSHLVAAAATAWAVCTRVRSAARRAVCTCVRGAAHRAVLSDSSSESLFSATECRRTCSRGPRRSADPSSTWMEGTSKWTRSCKSPSRVHNRVPRVTQLSTCSPQGTRRPARDALRTAGWRRRG